MRASKLRKITERKEAGMKKALSKKALVQEAAFWAGIKKASTGAPGSVCHK